VGSDIPDLNPDIVKQAFHLLDNVQVITSRDSAILYAVLGAEMCAPGLLYDAENTVLFGARVDLCNL
jgi:hypothetical protein